MNVTVLSGQNGGDYPVPGMTSTSKIMPVSFAMQGYPEATASNTGAFPVPYLIPANLNNGTGFVPGNGFVTDNTQNDWSSWTLVLLWE